MNILITGAAGFVGSNILKELNNGTNKITVFDNLKTGYKNNLPTNITFIEIDCCDEKILERCDLFYDLNSNAKSTLVLLEYAKNKQ